MTDLFNPNYVSLCCAYFSNLMNPTGAKMDRYTVNAWFSSKGILSDTQFRATGRLHDDNLHKIGEKQRLVTTDGRRSCIFISPGLANLPVRLPTDEEMDSYLNVLLTLEGKWKPSDLDMTYNGKIMMMTWFPLPTSLLPAIPNTMMYLRQSYNRPDTSPQALPLQMTWYSPRVPLMINYSLKFLNLTAANSITMTASLYVHQRFPLSPTVSTLQHTTWFLDPHLFTQSYLTPTPSIYLSVIVWMVSTAAAALRMSIN